MKRLISVLLLVPLLSQAQLTVSIQISDPPRCSNASTGILTAAVTGGTAPYTFLWNTGATTQVIFNQPAGTFSVQVTDGIGNIATDAATIVAPPSINVTLNPIPADHWGNLLGGNNGQIQTTVTGGVPPYTYEYQLLRYTPMTTAEAQSTMIGAAALNAYWTGIDSTNRKYFVEDPTNLEPGNYSIKITDANGCIYENNVTIPNLHPINVNVRKDTTSCWEDNDAQSGLGHIYGQGSHPFAYSNSNNPAAITLMYDASFTDALGVFHHVDSLQNGTLILDADTSIVFAHGSFPGYNPATVNFQVNPTRILTEGFYQGFWWTKVVSAEGYENILYGTTTYPQSPLSLSVTFGTILCFGGTSFAEGSADGSYGNYAWRWSSGETTARINNKLADSYSVFVTDINGCRKQESGKLTHPPKISSKINQERPVSCYGDSTAKVVAEISGGEGSVSATWAQTYQGTTIFTGKILDSLWAGKWYLHMIDQNNCQSDDSITISQPNPLQLFIDNVYPINCYGELTGSVYMHPEGGTMPIIGSVFRDGILFDYFRPQMLNLPVGNYNVEITDNRGCITSNTFEIQQPAEILVTVEVDNAICYGESSGHISIQVSGGTESFTILWTDGNTDFERDVPKGEYFATITDVNTNCSRDVHVFVYQPEKPEINYMVDGRSKTDGMTDGEIKIINVFYLSNPTFTLISLGGEQQTEITFDPFSNYPTFTSLDSGVYILTSTSDLGCIKRDSIYLPITNREVPIYIPEIFSPNGDGYNDVWNWPEVYSENCIEISIYYEANGALIFHSTGPYTNPWDGNWQNSGKICPEGKPYSYVLIYNDKGKRLTIRHFVVIKNK